MMSKQHPYFQFSIDCPLIPALPHHSCSGNSFFYYYPWFCFLTGARKRKRKGIAICTYLLRETHTHTHTLPTTPDQAKLHHPYPNTDVSTYQRDRSSAEWKEQTATHTHPSGQWRRDRETGRQRDREQREKRHVAWLEKRAHPSFSVIYQFFFPLSSASAEKRKHKIWI